MKICIFLFLAVTTTVGAAEYHVSVTGNDEQPGTISKPFRTISAAANVAQPGDTITVHAGIYRQSVTPPRGGTSDQQRITYQAAPGENVVITGSEVVKGWERVANATWKVVIPNTFFGGFNPYSDLVHGDWYSPRGLPYHTGAVYLNGDWLREAVRFDDVMKPAGNSPLWFGLVDATNTTLWAQFKGQDANPNNGNVEINVRKTVFTPDRSGINYITVRGFTIRAAATNWAPPSAGQIGMISAYWDKGWIIENNDIAYSKCVGVALGKYSDEFDNTNQAGAADPYTQCIRRALSNGWNKESVGSHIVRNNNIHHCEQAGIVGSMGCAFSQIIGNDIHDIRSQGILAGWEMAGIKFHGAIDVVIKDNHVWSCHECNGLWLDWMAQGTQIIGNLFHDNSYDAFCEVDHGPFLFANNIFLSPDGHLSWSDGGAYAHNLILGPVRAAPQGRHTPWFKPHSTNLVGLHDIALGDARWFNNLLGGADLSTYDKATLPVAKSGNVFNVTARLIRKPDGLYLVMNFDKSWRDTPARNVVTTKLLGKAVVADQAFENPDGSPIKIDFDYFGRKRDAANPCPGPLELSADEKQSIKVWPK